MIRPAITASIAFAAFLLLALGTEAAAVSENDFKPISYQADGLTTPYRFYAPPGLQAKVKYPLIIFLHGHGERGTDNHAQLAGECQGSWEFLSKKNQDKQKCFFIAPQTTVEVAWTDPKRTTQLAAIITELIAKNPIDADRIYLTGISGGGFGTFAMLAHHPELLACAIPQSGGGCGGYEKYKDMPLWCFHAADDNVVGVAGSDAPMEELRKLGGDPIYTRYATGGHGIWHVAYETPPLFEWMIAQKRGTANKAIVDFAKPIAGPSWVTSSPSAKIGGTALPIAALTALTWEYGISGQPGYQSGKLVPAAKWSLGPIDLSDQAVRLRVSATGPTFSSLGGTTTYSRTVMVSHDAAAADAKDPASGKGAPKSK